MDDSLKIILKKLEEIDNRIKHLEEKSISLSPKNQPSEKTPSPPSSQRDPLFAKAVEIMEKHEEISSFTLQQALKIDKTRAEKILDQLEAAGFGTCYWKEV